MKKTILGTAACAVAALALSMAGCSKNDECCNSSCKESSSCKDSSQTKCCKQGEAAKSDVPGNN